MSEITDTNLSGAEEMRRCPSCEHLSPQGTEYCPACGYPIAPRTRVPDAPTRQLARAPVTLPRDIVDSSHFPSGAHAVLQFLPSGTCVTLPMRKSVTLGRGTTPEDDEVLDLSGFNAVRHGVSRRHCKLERQGHKLVVTDVGSANGTYLNHDPLRPHHEYTVTHGDQLVLGTLHLFITFSDTGNLVSDED